MLNLRFEVSPRSTASVETALRALQALLPLAREWEAEDRQRFALPSASTFVISAPEPVQFRQSPVGPKAPPVGPKAPPSEPEPSVPEAPPVGPKTPPVGPKAPASEPEPEPEPEPEQLSLPLGPRVYSGEELRRAAIAAAKRTSTQSVKKFIAGLGVRSIVDVAPEDSAAVMDQLEALR